MANCKNCIHGCICGSACMNEPYGCGDFKDKSKIVELPCKIGDKVFIKVQGKEYAEADVCDYSHFISCGFCIVVTSKKFNKQHIPFSEIGKTVFLTREETERALEETDNE